MNERGKGRRALGKGLEAPVVFLADPSGEYAHAAELHINRSGESILGYMAVYGEKSGFQAACIALPGGWAALAEREERFSAAEELRLRYVAATRAGAALIVTQRTGKGGRNRFNPWHHFQAHIPVDAEIQDPGPVPAPAGGGVRLGEDEADRAGQAAAARWEVLTRPGREVAGAKEFALAAAAGPRPGPAEAPPAARATVDPAAGEHGVEWGTVIHALLEAALQRPGADLLRLARAALPEHGLDAGRAGEAVEVVRAVTGSELWKRALLSGRRFTEIPFEMEKADAGERPVLIRGAIDLAFWEEEGWVLVDYKTDRLRGRAPEDLVRRYAPQVRLYAEAWERGTGERPREIALYPVQEGLYLPVPAEG